MTIYYAFEASLQARLHHPQNPERSFLRFELPLEIGRGIRELFPQKAYVPQHSIITRSGRTLAQELQERSLALLFIDTPHVLNARQRHRPLCRAHLFGPTAEPPYERIIPFTHYYAVDGIVQRGEWNPDSNTIDSLVVDLQNTSHARFPSLVRVRLRSCDTAYAQKTFENSYPGDHLVVHISRLQVQQWERGHHKMIIAKLYDPHKISPTKVISPPYHQRRAYDYRH